ncbi:MAG: hypothetical protein V7K46_10985 [Nostoc sp.]
MLLGSITLLAFSYTPMEAIALLVLSQPLPYGTLRERGSQKSKLVKINNPHK